MATPSLICSIDGCKRAVSCLCRHCQKDVCAKHFNEHQIQVNDELIPITDRLNELKMQLRIDHNQTGPFALLQTWRDKKYKEIDNEYNRKVTELKKNISIHDNEINRTISNIQGLIDEGDVSIDQVKQIQKTIETLTNQVNQLLSIEPTNEENLIGTYLNLGGLQYLVKDRINCQNVDFYALESEKALVGYNGLCPQCSKVHVEFEANRGMYALSKTVHAKIDKQK